ncbi:MAG: DNA repair exonuclease [Clostridia bacterium]|nr:DNA repair exonuclease [Clostridia bacterium]
MKILFIHTADLHLGSPLKTAGNLSPQLQEMLQRAAYTAFERIVHTALEYDVDFMLISGDIYDDDSRSVAANSFFVEQMERLKEKNIPVFIIYGNHDPISENIELFKLPDNVEVFDAEVPETFEVADKRGKTARIIGQSYRIPGETRKMHLNYSFPNDGVLNIGMLHTSLSTSANIHVPCSLGELKGISGIHYWALGHIHKPQIIHKSHPVIAFPGIPQGRDMGEQGLRGFFLVEAQHPDTPGVYFIPTSPIIWIEKEVSIESSHGLEDIDNIEELILTAGNELKESPLPLPHSSLEPKGFGFTPDGYIVRWVITGRGTIHERVIEGKEEEIAAHLEQVLRENMDMNKPFVWTESVRINTRSPMPDMDDLIEKDEIIRILNDICSQMEREPELREKALSLLGNIWQRPTPEGSIPLDAVPLGEEKFRYLLELAQNMAVECILKERERIENSQDLF